MCQWQSSAVLSHCRTAKYDCDSFFVLLAFATFAGIIMAYKGLGWDLLLLVNISTLPTEDAEFDVVPKLHAIYTM